MQTYIAHAYLSHQGQIVKPSETLQLEDEQAKMLGDKVSKADQEQHEDPETNEYPENEPIPEVPLENRKAAELKEVAKNAGVKDYAKMKKSELIEAIQNVEE